MIFQGCQFADSGGLGPPRERVIKIKIPQVKAEAGLLDAADHRVFAAFREAGEEKLVRLKRRVGGQFGAGLDAHAVANDATVGQDRIGAYLGVFAYPAPVADNGIFNFCPLADHRIRPDDRAGDFGPVGDRTIVADDRIL